MSFSQDSSSLAIYRSCKIIASTLQNIMFMCRLKGNLGLRVQIITSIHFIPPILNPKKTLEK